MIVREGGRRASVAAVVVVGLSSVVAGCGHSSETVRAPASSSTSVSGRSDPAPGETSGPYALLEAEGWTLQEAVDWPPDNLLSDLEPVPSDWWAEYKRLDSPASGVIVSRTVKLAGFDAGLDTYRAAMEPFGFTFRPVETAFGPGVSGTTEEQGSSPVVVAVPLGDGTLELLAYELSGEDLVALVGELRLVDDAAWRAAGGVVE